MKQMKKRILIVFLAGILLIPAACKNQTVLLSEQDKTQAGEEGGQAEKQEKEKTKEEKETPAGAAVESAEETKETHIWVHVCGAVREPGVYELLEGSRIFDAVRAAGGMEEGAAAAYLNMAQLLTDGCKLVVPYQSEITKEEQYGGAYLQEKEEENGQAAGAAAGEPVDLNHADLELLMTLPGIGQVKAEAILAYRKENGAFEKPEDLMKIPGIKQASYDKLKDKITVR